MDQRLSAIASALSACPAVVAVTQTGDGFPKAGEGDVDIFVYAQSIPASAERTAILAPVPMEELHIARFDGPAWGVGDLLMIDGVEVYLMWFTTAHALEEARSILRGEQLDMLYGQLYPTGRLATILDLKPLFVRGDFLRDIQQEVKPYPEALSRALVQRHLGGLWDTETFDRAVSRGEVLLYHQALEHGLDCFLQALFALNRVYFPSRKRTLSFLQGFAVQPIDCGNRLLKIVRLGSEANTLSQSYAEWQTLLSELRALAN